MKNFIFIGFILAVLATQAQHPIKKHRQVIDSLFVEEVENARGPEKILHAEPLYIDLIRDLGARKGEREWNVGMGLTDNLQFDTYEALVEYEWAPINRLGLEVEVPFTFHARNSPDRPVNLPSNRIESLKLAAQWSFLVKTEWKTTMALGYLHEFELHDLNQLSRDRVFKGNIYNPFFIAAKRFGENYHTLIYTGPVIEQIYQGNKVKARWENNTSFHYMISGTRNFLGIEVNQQFDASGLEMTLRPQMRLGIADNLMIGIVGGIPISRETQRLSSFVRLIYEPGHRKH